MSMTTPAVSLTTYFDIYALSADKASPRVASRRRARGSDAGGAVALQTPLIDKHSDWPVRTMVGHSATLADAMVRRVIWNRLKVDTGVRLKSLTQHADLRMTVQLCTGDGVSLKDMQHRASKELPFCQIQVDESMLDGSMVLTVIIPSADEERASMRRFVARRRAAAYGILLFWTLVVAAAVDYVSTVRSNYNVWVVMSQSLQRAFGKDEL